MYIYITPHIDVCHRNINTFLFYDHYNALSSPLLHSYCYVFFDQGIQIRDTSKNWKSIWLKINWKKIEKKFWCGAAKFPAFQLLRGMISYAHQELSRPYYVLVMEWFILLTFNDVIIFKLLCCKVWWSMMNFMKGTEKPIFPCIQVVGTALDGYFRWVL